MSEVCGITPKTTRKVRTQYLELREPLDSFKRPQNSQNPEGFYCLDVSTFVVPVDIDTIFRNLICMLTSTHKDMWHGHVYDDCC